MPIALALHPLSKVLEIALIQLSEIVTFVVDAGELATE